MSNDTDRPIIIDFGDAEMCKKGKTYTEFVGTPPYMSPERLGEHNVNQLKKSDVWALGAIAYEMYSGKRCFEGDSQKQVFRAILSGQWSWNEDRLPTKDMMDFVSKCLTMNYEQRLSAKEALNHSWFADIITKNNKQKNANMANMANIERQLQSEQYTNTITKVTMLTDDDNKNDDNYNGGDENDNKDIGQKYSKLWMDGIDFDKDGPTDEHGMYLKANHNKPFLDFECILYRYGS